VGRKVMALVFATLAHRHVLAPRPPVALSAPRGVGPAGVAAPAAGFAGDATRAVAAAARRRGLPRRRPFALRVRRVWRVGRSGAILRLPRPGA
jgi:hypothetical protein